MSANDSQSKTAAFLKEHPKLIGWLFATAVALSQVGAVAASGMDSIAGP